MVAILKELDAGTAATELARRHDLHANTIRQWRDKYAWKRRRAFDPLPAAREWPLIRVLATTPYPRLQVRAGVLVADGFGITLSVLYGKLHLEDGIGPHRRSIALDRAGSGLERLVLLGKTGTLTLESLAWIRAVGAGLIHLSGDGDVLTHSVPYGYDGHPIRRAQAMAIATGLDVDLARDLIARKMAGQRANLARLRVADLRSFDAMREALDRADSIADVRLCEAKAAAIYWNAWSNVPIRLRGRDLAKVPARWARYDARSSVLTGAPRAATNPVNAFLNFTYSLLETESRLALLGAGLDPTLGVLHADQRNRDSFAWMRWSRFARR